MTLEFNKTIIFWFFAKGKPMQHLKRLPVKARFVHDHWLIGLTFLVIFLSFGGVDPKKRPPPRPLW